ncbi:hypothetical protein PsYK624_154530 [Phanerochaete sordida]|uniref:Uncharacterized protein n=1 Tax=Phanerochaete sordida TaxID=48140 RepID=A0A9P3LLZ5_9APHY|nr:hypothetical protein PsYK624_154530 [Phanerochaete sordida]
MVLNSCSDSCRVDLPVRHCVVKDELANPENLSDTAIASPWTLPLGEIDKIELVRTKLLLDALPVRAKVTLGALDRMQHAASSSGSIADGAVDDRRSENRHPQPCGLQTLLVVLGLLIWRAFWVRGQERRQTSIRPCLRNQEISCSVTCSGMWRLHAALEWRPHLRYRPGPPDWPDRRRVVARLAEVAKRSQFDVSSSPDSAPGSGST